MKKFVIMFLVKMRWWYFHINPSYIKFYMDSESKEAHFQNIKTGQIHSNFVWVEE